MLSFFKKKKKEEELKKIEMKLNPSNRFIEYKCPYCNYLIKSEYYAVATTPDLDKCPSCLKDFLK